MALALFVSGCTATVATPTPQASQPPATLSPTGTPTPIVSPEVSPTVRPTDQPNTSFTPTEYQLLKGSAALLAPAPDGGKLAAEAIDQFAFDLFGRLDQTGNLCVSPASIALSLAMVEPGAKGDTATQLDAVLHSLGSDANGAEIVALMKQLSQDTLYVTPDGFPLGPDQKPPKGLVPANELRVANAAFLQKDMTVLPAFLNALSSRFGAGIGILDFQNQTEPARLAINKWAGQQTNGRITDPLQPGDLTPQTRFALANAIYLRASWDKTFDKADTKSLAFHRRDGSAVSVPTMARTLETLYGAGNGWQVVRLPYLYNQMSMTVLVPDDMTAFTSGLTWNKVSTILNSEQRRLVDLTFPRFSIESRIDLASVLKIMGMAAPFDTSKADLSGITGDRSLALDKVIHVANIDVTEEGTTASAVTITTGAGAAAPPTKVTLRVDKPFLYLITDTATGAVLFMGRVDDPSITR